jgi:diaminopropionate ammonia-lyase
MTISAEINALVPGVTAVVVPVGVGSFAHSVVKYYGPGGVRDTSARIISAEPDAAPCLHESLKAGKLTNTPGSRFTIMPGLNCGTVNHQAWPDLQAAIQPQDAVVVNDDECRAAVADLNTLGVPAGPCGAATLAAARKVEFGKEDVVVLIVTEGNQEDK